MGLLSRSILLACAATLLLFFGDAKFVELDRHLVKKLPVIDRQEAIAAQKHIDLIRASIASQRARFATLTPASRIVAEAELDATESDLREVQRELVLLGAESLETRHQIELSFPKQRPPSTGSTLTPTLQNTSPYTFP
jgi:hypothetical protein